MTPNHVVNIVAYINTLVIICRYIIEKPFCCKRNLFSTTYPSVILIVPVGRMTSCYMVDALIVVCKRWVWARGRGFTCALVILLDSNYLSCNETAPSRPFSNAHGRRFQMANLVFNITSAVANVMSWYTSIDQIVFFFNCTSFCVCDGTRWKLLTWILDNQYTIINAAMLCFNPHTMHKLHNHPSLPCILSFSGSQLYIITLAFRIET